MHSILNAYGPYNLNQNTDSGIRDRLLRGGGAQGLSQAVQVFIRIAEVPLLLTFWGPQLYGEWLMLTAIPAYLSIGDGGFAAAACREMAIRGGAGDKSGVRTVFQSTWLLLLIVSISVGIIGVGFVIVTPIEAWLGFTSMNDMEIKFVFLLLIAHVLIVFQAELLNGGFWVTGRYPSGMYLIAFTLFIEFAGLSIAVALGGGPVQAAAGYLTGRLLGTGLLWLGQRRASPWLRLGVVHASLKEIKRLTFPAFASLAFPLGNAFNIQGIRLILGLTLGPTAVAIFVPIRTLSRIVMQPGAIINRLIQPELAFAYGAKDDSLFQSIFARSCQLSLWGCLGFCFIIGPSAIWIFPTWTGGMISMHWPTYFILLGGVLVNSIWCTALMVPYALNRHGLIAFYYILLYGLTASGLSFVWAKNFGLGGVALALFIAEAAMAVVVIYFALPMAGAGIVPWAKTVLRPPFNFIGRSVWIFGHDYRPRRNDLPKRN